MPPEKGIKDKAKLNLGNNYRFVLNEQILVTTDFN